MQAAKGCNIGEESMLPETMLHEALVRTEEAEQCGLTLRSSSRR
jgi:hypothetical protein